jgi:hypothetical protein
MKALLIFGRFAHDPQSVLATIYRLTFMSIELSFHIGTFELGIAAFAHTDGRRVSLYDSQIALGHWTRLPCRYCSSVMGTLSMIRNSLRQCSQVNLPTSMESKPPGIMVFSRQCGQTTMKTVCHRSRRYSTPVEIKRHHYLFPDPLTSSSQGPSMAVQWTHSTSATDEP